MNHQLQQLVAQTVTHFTSVNMLPINASNIPKNPGIQSCSLDLQPALVLSHCWISIFFERGSAFDNDKGTQK